jgi:hypothetical protein
MPLRCHPVPPWPPEIHWGRGRQCSEEIPRGRRGQLALKQNGREVFLDPLPTGAGIPLATPPDDQCNRLRLGFPTWHFDRRSKLPSLWDYRRQSCDLLERWVTVVVANVATFISYCSSRK